MLINCAAYCDGRKLADIEIGAIHDYLQRPDCFVWVALQDASPDELRVLQAQLELPELAVEDALHGHQRPKVEEYGDCLFTVLHLLHHEPAQIEVGELAVFTGPRFVLSVRNRSEQRFLGVRARSEREPELLRFGPGYVLYALMDAVVDRYFPLVEQLEDELEQIEADIFGDRLPGRATVERLYLLKRRTTVLKQAAAPLLHDIGRLYGGRVPGQVAAVQDYVRDVADHLTRINASIDGLRDTIATAIQVNLSLVTIDDGAVTKRLAAYAAIFGVWTALAGLWGMNFEFMPELGWRYGYLFALGLITAACAALFIRFRRIGWL
ncbi:magnesium and cobalt transport protein CorA [Ramlibacter sp. AW1]|uniref:Magnesium and cobalt transport protein CorA n=1 Tax=Ramlibacter aurantiacus TaxID=2801330 RepID=A0A936ZWH1_9BURK|nr:magnesium and cobalt transport protein CorA [Ramlibacter aurantiacus]MBL0421814.1 magnesium and cobalt transport protein CorA [Ramlibacter aurantiacus]